ncbi:unnamed protein product, partial [Brassica rapa subsp. narinosa]
RLESGISLDLDGIFYLGADLEGFLKIGSLYLKPSVPRV